MIVHDLHVIGVAVSPDEAQAPLVVDADTVLSGTVTAERLQLISRRRTQFRKFLRGSEDAQFASRHSRKITRKSLRHTVDPNCRRALVCEGPNHDVIRSAYRGRLQD